MTIRNGLPGPRLLLLVAGLLCLARPLPAQSMADPDPGRVRPGSYVIEPEHTQVEFAVLHLGFTTYYGRFSSISGRLLLSPSDPSASRLSVDVPAATVSTTSAALNRMLQGPDWLDAARYPQIAFASTRVRRTGPADAEVEGELTLHGVTRPVTLAAHFVGAGFNPLDGKYTVGFQVSGAIRRSAFGVSTYVPLVGDEVRLTISGAFEREG